MNAIPRGSPHFLPLRPQDIPSAYRLSSLAGWNQTEEDWRRLARLHPEGVGVWRDQGEIRASFSVTPYPGKQEVGWIGMILVDPVYRGRGIGGAAFAAALRHLADLGLEVAGLDATNLGEPVYRKHGFEVIQAVTRWRGKLKHGAAPPASGLCFDLEPEFDEMVALDERCSGVNRAPVLQDLVQHGGRSLAVRGPRGELSAYGVIRPGREAWQFGPMVSPKTEAIPLLLEGLVRLLGPGAECLCDVPDGAMTEAAFQAVGLTPSRHLQRMTRPRQPDVLCGPGVRCVAGFELG